MKTTVQLEIKSVAHSEALQYRQDSEHATVLKQENSVTLEHHYNRPKSVTSLVKHKSPWLLPLNVLTIIIMVTRVS